MRPTFAEVVPWFVLVLAVSKTTGPSVELTVWCSLDDIFEHPKSIDVNQVTCVALVRTLVPAMVLFAREMCKSNKRGMTLSRAFDSTPSAGHDKMLGISCYS